MPSKQLLPLNRFDGGLNTSTNPRDLNDTEYVTGDNIDSSVAGRLRFLGKWDDYADVSGLNELNDIFIQKGGYGIFYFPVDNDVNDGSEIDGRYLAVFEPRAGVVQTVDTVAVPTAPVGTYNDVGYITNGSGLDAVFNIQVTNPDGLVATITVVNGGKDFAVNETITATFGGGGVTFDVATIADSPKVNLYIEPTSNGINSCTAPIILTASGVQGSGSADENTRIDYLYIDGALRVFDHDHKFDPQKWWFLDDGYTYFQSDDNTLSGDQAGAGNNYPLDYTSATWKTDVNSGKDYIQSKQFVEPPTGGVVVTSSGTTPYFPDNDTEEASVSLPETGTEVGLICHIWAGSNPRNDFTGWGDGDKDTAQYYHFYASFVYDGNQESNPAYINTNASGSNVSVGISLGGHNGEANKNNDVSFIAVVRPRKDDGTIVWNPRITSVRIYYKVAEKSQDNRSTNSVNDDNLFFIGDYPTRTTTSIYDADHIAKMDYNVTTNRGYAYLLGDGSGKGAGYVGVGIYHKNPPVIFTHAVKSRIKKGTVSVECRYKTGVILNRRLYVGNIKQRTETSPGVETVYPDRLLKSAMNRFDVLPDNSFVDVAVRDGESIVKLAGMGNRLLQFKENSLYVIVVAGGEEYLEAKYPDMGVRHPNAVTTFTDGIFWVNDFGAYIFTGEKAPINLINNKIDPKDWKTFITDNSMTGYYAREKKLFVMGNTDTVWEAASSTDEMYIFNLLTQSWNKQTGMAPFGDTAAEVVNTDKVSNIVSYTDTASGESHMLFLTGRGSGSTGAKSRIVEYKSIDDLSADFPLAPTSFITKEITFGSPHHRKKIYGCYLTYKGYMTQDNETGSGTDYIPPDLKLRLVSQNKGYDVITLEPKNNNIIDNATGWETAQYVVKTADKAKARNVYTVQVEVAPGAGSTKVDSSFQINDFSLVYRVKSIK